MHLAVARRFFAPSHNDANADDDVGVVARRTEQGNRAWQYGKLVWHVA